MGFGTEVDSLFRVSDSFSHATSALDHRGEGDTEPVIWYDDIQERSGGFFYPIEFEDRGDTITQSAFPRGREYSDRNTNQCAERDGKGDGRVYHLEFTATDGTTPCSGHVRIGIVDHDQSEDLDAMDGGPLYDSTK